MATLHWTKREPDEIRARAQRMGEAYAADAFDVEEALYWFAADYHDGQWSPLYEILSTSPYRPGPMRNAPEPDSVAAMIYEDLRNGMEA